MRPRPEPGGPPGDGQRPAEDVRRLRNVDLRLKLDDLFDLLARGRGAGLLVTHDGAHRLGLQRGFTGIGHEIHADRLPGFRIDIGQHAGLKHDRRATGNNVLQDSPPGADGDRRKRSAGRS